MKKILFIDDDPQVLQGFRRMLHSMRANWQMEFTSSARQALKSIENSSFDVVLCGDVRMPEMDGAQLLTEVKKRSPQTVRIMLSGQADEAGILHSIAPSHQYLSKPCDPQLLKSTLERACALRDSLKDEKLKRLVSQLVSLPSLPALYVRITQELRSPDPSIRTVGEIISSDVAMSAKILQLVNSAYFGFYRHISSPRQAAILLGLKTLRALVLSVHIFSQYDQSRLKDFNIELIMNHSIATGAFAMSIAGAEKLNQEAVDDAYLAGLLHDIGKLVLAENLPQEYSEILTRVRTAQVELPQAEREAFGATHAEVGAYLLGLWGMEDAVRQATEFHHYPSKCPKGEFSPLTAVHVANVLELKHRAADVPGPAPQLDADYLQKLGLAGRLGQWESICQQIVQEKKS